VDQLKLTLILHSRSRSGCWRCPRRGGHTRYARVRARRVGVWRSCGSRPREPHESRAAWARGVSTPERRLNGGKYSNDDIQGERAHVGRAKSILSGDDEDSTASNSPFCRLLRGRCRRPCEGHGVFLHESLNAKKSYGPYGYRTFNGDFTASSCSCRKMKFKIEPK
jgi:hypothetical protein